MTQMELLTVFVEIKLKRNIIEAMTQVAAGTVLIFCSNLLVFKILGIQVSTTDNLLLIGINTIVAFAKSYAVRSFFQQRESKT